MLMGLRQAVKNPRSRFSGRGILLGCKIDLAEHKCVDVGSEKYIYSAMEHWEIYLLSTFYFKYNILTKSFI